MGEVSLAADSICQPRVRSNTYRIDRGALFVERGVRAGNEAGGSGSAQVTATFTASSGQEKSASLAAHDLKVLDPLLGIPGVCRRAENSLLTGKNTGNLRFLACETSHWLLSKLQILLEDPRAKGKKSNREIAGQYQGVSFPDGLPEQGMYLDLAQPRESELFSLFSQAQRHVLIHSRPIGEVFQEPSDSRAKKLRLRPTTSSRQGVADLTDAKQTGQNEYG